MTVSNFSPSLRGISDYGILNRTRISEVSSCKCISKNINDGRFLQIKFEITNSNVSLVANSSRSQSLPIFEEGELDRPSWSGDNPLSKFVAFLISIKPLFALMKLGARDAFIKTAEKNGVPWRKIAKDLASIKRIEEIKENIEDKSLVYPSYYLQEFHGYEEGNLCWKAAFEVEAATYSMCKRTFPDSESVESAAVALRGGWLQAINRHLSDFCEARAPQRIIDMGCSAGVSTRFLADAYPNAEVYGVDASAYFLSVAVYREEERKVKRENEIKYIHALAEDSKLPSNHFDLVSVAYLVHECTEQAIIDIFREAKRILKPGGVLVVTDNSPKSKTIQNLPGPIAVLMKSTEPWYDASFNLDLEQTARGLGFTSVVTVLTDPRHRTMTATA